MTKHTKGPWHRNIKPASKYPIVFAGRNTHVAQVCTQGLSADEIEADINLITAAPELLEALESFLELDEIRIKQLESTQWGQACLESACTAIAKAKGQ